MTLIDNPPTSLATPTAAPNNSNGSVTVLIAPELSAEESSSSIAFKQRGKVARANTGLSDQDDVRKDRSLSVFDICKDTFDYALSRWRMEKVLLRLNWRILACGIVFQYFHSVATNVVYYLHVPRTPLYDLGFELFPALSRQMQIVSEIMFFILLFSTIFFIASPLLFRRQSHLFTTTMATRFLGVCFFAQVLRCMTFLVTVLPGPNYHCRPGAPDYSPPQNLYDIFLRQDAFYGCGDLVFSSHTIFVCLCALTITKYADFPLVKKAVWVLVFFFGCLVVSARKHYSIDILVAWYTVPLLWIAFDKYYPDRIPTEFLENSDSEPKKAPKVVV